MPGWPYSVVTALDPGRTPWTAVLEPARTSWTAVLDADRWSPAPTSPR
ncbi:hypothetical protein [Streptomyces roseifaciens]|nr:hypothetical protein [Streptomyces roseifaciens]